MREVIAAQIVAARPQVLRRRLRFVTSWAG
jgi:hypothetical protein